MTFFDNVQWQVALNLSGVVLTAVALLALAGLPVMAIAGENMARICQRSSYDKCGRQLACLATLLGWLLTLAGAAVFWLRFGPSGVMAIADIAAPTPSLAHAQGAMLVWLTLLCGTFFASLHFALWRSLRAWPLLHQCMGLLAVLLCYVGLYGIMALVAADTATALGDSLPDSLAGIFLPEEESTLWNSLAYLPPLTLSMAGAVGALWLLLRRHRDDYGRDHYMQMVPWCAVWARNSWIVLWVLLAAFTALNLWYAQMDSGVLSYRELLDAGLYLLLWIIPALLWTIVCRSSSPLRHKLTLLLTLVLSMFFVAAVYLGLIGV